MTVIIYCKNHRRRPIRLGYTPVFRDVQGDIPAGWCSNCGCEVFEQGEDRCKQCRNVKGE